VYILEIWDINYYCNHNFKSENWLRRLLKCTLSEHDYHPQIISP